jgi:DNA-binding MarR family transcriptional regulator
MNTPVKISETYLYKIHSLANLLNKVFDQTLRTHAGITLSQFMVLLAIAELKTANQRQIARFLGVSHVAVKRQVDLAAHRGRIEVVDQNTGRGEQLQLTPKAAEVVADGLRVLEQHVFKIFDSHNRTANLMQHLDILLDGTKEIIDSKSDNSRKDL